MDISEPIIYARFCNEIARFCNANPIDVQACAVEMHIGISQGTFYGRIGSRKDAPQKTYLDLTPALELTLLGEHYKCLSGSVSIFFSKDVLSHFRPFWFCDE